MVRDHRSPFRPGLQKTLLALLALMTVAAGGLAQGPPDTDIFLVSLSGEGDERPSFGEPVNLTQRVGYDNQPAFLPDGSGLLYSSIREGQSDIYLYDFESETSSAILSTPESEYSPTPIEGGRAISVVRVEEDSRQRIWRFPMTPSKEIGVRPLYPEVDGIGYHAWGDDGTAIVFRLGDPPSIWYLAPEADPKALAENVGRSLQRIPGTSTFGFVVKKQSKYHLAVYDPETSILEMLISTKFDREDVTWDGQGRAWAADGARLYRYCSDCGGGWRRMVDFTPAGLGEISRLAFSADGTQLALVVTMESAEPAAEESVTAEE